jgi:hypothetical protein
LVASRGLTLPQVLDAVHTILASKARHDAKCAAGGLAHETLEQHVFSWLNQRYGLRELIMRHAAALLDGVKAHAPVCPDLAVFAAILANDIDEGFLGVAAALRATAADLLKSLLSHYAAETTSALMAPDVDALLAARVAAPPVREGDAIPLSPPPAVLTAPAPNASAAALMTAWLSAMPGVTGREWRWLVAYMYSPEDAAVVTARLRQAALHRAAAVAFKIPLRADPADLPVPPPHSPTPDGSWASLPAVVDAALAMHPRLQAVIHSLPPSEQERLLSAVNPHLWLPWDSVVGALVTFQLQGHVA